MKVSKFSEQHIALILKQADDGLGIDEVCRKAGATAGNVCGHSSRKRCPKCTRSGAISRGLLAGSPRSAGGRRVSRCNQTRVA